jgi:hypothetical protein
MRSICAQLDKVIRIRIGTSIKIRFDSQPQRHLLGQYPSFRIKIADIYIYIYIYIYILHQISLSVRKDTGFEVRSTFHECVSTTVIHRHKVHNSPLTIFTT